MDLENDLGALAHTEAIARAYVRQRTDQFRACAEASRLAQHNHL